MKIPCLSLILILSIAPLHAENLPGERVSYDPYEGYNRIMFGFNDALDRAVLAPVARGYRAVTPTPVRSGIGNFFNNLRDLLSVGHNLLRLDVTKAGSDLVRVGINTTFGFGGLINIADAAGMPNNKTTLGDTLASWGWENSHYFVYPIIGPSTVRDAVGQTISYAYPIENAVFKTDAGSWTAQGIKAIDTRTSLLAISDGVEQAALDRYAYTRDAFMAARARQLGQTWEHHNHDDYVPSFEENGTTGETGLPQAPIEPVSSTEAPISANPQANDIHPRDLPPNAIHIVSYRIAVPSP